jgi:uncharacterized membrane protein
MAAPTFIVAATQRLERNPSLDALVDAIAVAARPLDRQSWSGLLRSDLIGHALHPLMTDLPIGCWTAATLLDLRGRREDRAASRWLIGVGLAAVGPTALTGVAEWARAGRANQRVGAAHAALNGVAGALYAASFLSRRRGRHSWGVVAAAGGAAVTGLSGYLGGHLTTARKVSSRDASYAHDPIGPPGPADAGDSTSQPVSTPAVAPQSS